MNRPPNYRRIRLLGQGGQARVELVQNLATGAHVALKFPSSPSPSARAFFRAEVALLSRLSHPNLVKILDYRDDGDAPYYAMEYVDGVTIDRALGAASPEETLALFVALCRGLHYLHARDILHGDLKPSNVLVDAGGRVKILDFGLGVVATPQYSAPEALSGRPSPESDLFSIGKIFTEARPSDLPDYFRDLIDRLTRPDPAERPRSALSVLKYVNHHAAKPFEIGPEEDAFAVLQKPSWVPRKEETVFWNGIEAAGRKEGPGLLRLTGPTGVGRSRFLEEMAWRRKLSGDLTEWIVFEDLHERDEAFLDALAARLRRERRKTKACLFILEYAHDRIPAALVRLVEETNGWGTTLALGDLTSEQSRSFIDRATAGSPLDAERREALVEGSGGRPLLLVESLRRPEAPAPRNLADAARSRTALLSEAESGLLSVLVAHPLPVSLEDASAVSGFSERDLQDARLALQTQGFLAAVDVERPALRLAHPSLRDHYRAGLPSARLLDAHAHWVRHLTAAPTAPELIAGHALAAGDADALKRWGAQAVASLMAAGRLESALCLCDELLAFPGFAGDPVQEYTWQGHRAPLLSRLGHYEAALDAYDRWRAAKPDDGTGVEDVKHRLYTAMVLGAAGRREEAERRLHDCLKTGDSSKYDHHRPYHARALFLLGSPKDLETAAELAKGHPLLLGEIENQRGLLKQSEGRMEEALALFRSAVGHYREADNAHAEAIAHHSLSLLYRATGRLEDALEEMNEAVRLAEASGEPAQILRYRLNRGLLFLDLSRYREAFETYESVRDAVDPSGAEGRFLEDFKQELRLLIGLREDPEALEASLVVKTARFPAARAALDFLKSLDAAPGEEETAARLERTLAAVKDTPSAEARAELYGRLALGLKRSGFSRLAHALGAGRLKELKRIHRSLPEELKPVFENKRGLRRN